MICNALSGNLDKSCGNNVGGINKIYVADFENITVATGASASGTIVTGITMASTTEFYEIKTNKNTANLQETTAIDLQAGTTVITQVATVVIPKRSTAARTFVEKLTDSQKQLAVILLDSNSVYWLMDVTEGVYVTSVESGSGTAKTDANNYTVTFTAMGSEQCFEVDPTIIAGIIA